MATIIVPALVFVDEDDDDDGCPVFASSNESADDVTVSGSTGENRLRFRNPRTRTHSHTHTQTLRHGHTNALTHTHTLGREKGKRKTFFFPCFSRDSSWFDDGGAGGHDHFPAVVRFRPQSVTLVPWPAAICFEFS